MRYYTLHPQHATHLPTWAGQVLTTLHRTHAPWAVCGLHWHAACRALWPATTKAQRTAAWRAALACGAVVPQP